MNSFVKYSRLLFSSAVSEVASARRFKGERVMENLKEIQISVKNCNEGSSCFIVQAIDKQSFGNYMSGEAARFWLASMLSFVRARQCQESNAAWQVVELYYAAYYAVHFTMRLTGFSLSNLDAGAVSHIQRANLTEKQIAPSTGLYKIDFRDLDNIEFTKMPKGGGSHKDAWCCWESIIKELLLKAEDDILEYASESISLIEHQKFVYNGGGYGPPKVRSEINYQFKGSLWAFEQPPKRHINKINEMVLGSVRAVSGKVSQPESLIASSNYVVYLATALFDAIINRYPNSILNKLHQKYAGEFSEIITNFKPKT